MEGHLKELMGKLESWITTPTGAIVSIILAVSFLDAIRRAWGSSHPASSFFLWWLTGALYLPLIVSPFAAAIYCGMKAGKKSGQVWLGWIVGLALAFVFSGVVTWAITEIPGIGWRFRAFLEASGDDY
jgi:hypothetical protein